MKLYWDRRMLRARVLERAQAPDNHYKAQEESTRSAHIYSNIESLYVCGDTSSPNVRESVRPYPEFSSPVNYEEIDTGRDSNYTTFTDLSVYNA